MVQPATLPKDVQGPPPPPNTPNFPFGNLLFWASWAIVQGPISTLTTSIFRMLGPAELRRPLDANSLEIRSHGAYWNFRSFVPLTCATLRDHVQGTPPPPYTPLMLHFGHAALCRAKIEHIEQFQPSYYQFGSIGLYIAHDAIRCKFTWCQIIVTCCIAGSCRNFFSSITPMHTGTMTKVARIAKKFSACLAIFGAW